MSPDLDEEKTVELRDYWRAVACRWAWLVALGLLGAVLAGSLSARSETSYESSVSLYVGASVVSGDDDPAYAALVQTQVLPSVAALARSSQVLQDAAADAHLSAAAGQLLGAVSVASGSDASVLTITVTDPSPSRARSLAGAVADEVQRESALVFPGTKGSPLSVGVLGAPGPALPAARIGTSGLTAIGALVGVLLAVLAAGLAELARPRVRGTRDVHAVSGAPAFVLPSPAGRRRVRAAVPWRSHVVVPDRAEEMRRLAEALTISTGSGARIAILGADGSDTAARVAADLASVDRAVDPVVVRDLRGRSADSFAGVLLVADGRRTGRRDLAQAVEAVGATGRRLLGVVVDGVLPPRAAWRARLAAGLRGQARWLVEHRQNSVPEATRSRRERLAALAALAALGFAKPLPLALSTGLVAAVLLLPLWAPVVRRYRGAPLLFTVTGLGVLCGVLLAWRHASDHGVDSYGFRLTTMLIVTGVCGVGLILWAREFLSLPLIGMAYGAGALAYGVLMTPAAPNPWKFTLSFPVMILALSVVAARRRPLLSAATLLVLGLISVAEDYRSAFAFCVVAVLPVLWQSRPSRGGTGRIRWWAVLPAFAALAAGGYWLLTRLLLSGLLGSAVQARTATQIRQSGSLILGGRPEWTATWALMHDSPLGFGLGTIPTAHDVAVAEAGLAVAHIPGVNGYVTNQLLDLAVHLHSIIADLWAAIGPLGLLLGLLMAGLMVRALAERIIRGEAGALVCLLVPLGLWDLAFGPLQDNLPTVTLALGLLLFERGARRRTAAPPPASSVALPSGTSVLAGAR